MYDKSIRVSSAFSKRQISCEKKWFFCDFLEDFFPPLQNTRLYSIKMQKNLHIFSLILRYAKFLPISMRMESLFQ